jgi:hypothetical protein
MNRGRYAVVLVPSTGHALRAERVLHLAGIETKLIPVPRSLSSDCGVCVRIQVGDSAAAEAALARSGAEHEGIVGYD